MKNFQLLLFLIPFHLYSLETFELGNLGRLKVDDFDDTWTVEIFRGESVILSAEIFPDGFRLDAVPAAHLYPRRAGISLIFQEGALSHNGVTFYRKSDYLYILDVNRDFLYDIVTDVGLRPTGYLVTSWSSYIDEHSDEFSQEYFGNFMNAFDPWVADLSKDFVSLDINAMIVSGSHKKNPAENESDDIPTSVPLSRESNEIQFDGIGLKNSKLFVIFAPLRSVEEFIVHGINSTAAKHLASLSTESKNYRIATIGKDGEVERVEVVSMRSVDEVATPEVICYQIF